MNTIINEVKEFYRLDQEDKYQLIEKVIKLDADVSIQAFRFILDIEKDPDVLTEIAMKLGKFSCNLSVKQMLAQLIENDDSYVRAKSLESMMLAGINDDVKRYVLNGLRDQDEMVKLIALEGVVDFQLMQDLEYLHILKELTTHDESPLVRGYAVDSLTYVNTKEVIQHLEKEILDEPDEWVLVQYNTAFYLLKKDPRYLLKVIEAVSSEDYEVGCLAVNTLKELINDQNRELIMDSLAKQTPVDHVVTETLNGLLELERD